MSPLRHRPCARDLARLCAAFCAGLAVWLAPSGPALAQTSPAQTSPAQTSPAGTVEVTDVAGRTVRVKAPVERVILGEGRQTYFTAVLDKEDPFRRVVGWRDDLAKADPNTYRSIRAEPAHRASCRPSGA